MTQTVAGESLAAELMAPVDRRGFVARCGAASMAGVTIAAAPAPAVAAAGVRTYRGRYAIDAHRIVDGYFAWPRGRAARDVVLVIPAAGSTGDKAEAVARDHAANGRVAVVPDLSTTYRRSSGGGRRAMLAALDGDLHRFGGLAARGSRVMFASA